MSMGIYPVLFKNKPIEKNNLKYKMRFYKVDYIHVQNVSLAKSNKLLLQMLKELGMIFCSTKAIKVEYTF